MDRTGTRRGGVGWRTARDAWPANAPRGRRPCRGDQRSAVSLGRSVTSLRCFAVPRGAAWLSQSEANPFFFLLFPLDSRYGEARFPEAGQQRPTHLDPFVAQETADDHEPPRPRRGGKDRRGAEKQRTCEVRRDNIPPSRIAVSAGAGLPPPRPGFGGRQSRGEIPNDERDSSSL